METNVFDTRCQMGLETILISAGVNAATAATISSAVATASTVASVAGTVIGGIQQRGASKAAAAATSAEAQRQADLRQQETEQRARVEARENIELEKRQKLAFIKSGVDVGVGSPLLVLAETERKGEENIEAILKTGRTQATGLLATGAAESRRLKASGRQALISGLTTGATRAAPLFKPKG